MWYKCRNRVITPQFPEWRKDHKIGRHHGRDTEDPREKGFFGSRYPIGDEETYASFGWI